MRYLGWSAAIVLLLLAPNLIWLGTSTVRIHNASKQSIGSVAYIACEKKHPLGTLERGQSIFRFLESCGDDTVEIVIGDSRFCQAYVEGELYHVDAAIKAVDKVACEYEHLFSTLFITEAFW